MKSNLSLTIIAFLMALPLFFKGQDMMYKAATVARPAEFWKPFVLINGTNTDNGVSFYVIETACELRTTKLLKVVNVNPYQVIFSYQLSASDQIVNVNIPASSSLEGECDTSDKNTAKLTFIPSSKIDNTDIPKLKFSQVTVKKKQ